MAKNPFTFHTNEEYSEAGTDQLVGNCVFCGGHDSFYINSETWQWDCKKGKCTLSGNLYTFIALFHNKCCGEEKLHALGKGIPIHVLEANHVRWNPFNNTYVIPTYAKNGSVNNLFKYVPSNNTLYGTPTLAAPLYNFEIDSEQEVWLCEGLWDKMACEAMFGTAHAATAMAVPGAATFKDAWVEVLKDKDVIICYDNDQGGYKGIDKVLKKLADSPQKPTSLRVVRWPEELAEGYDLRDAFVEHGKDTYKYLTPFIEDIEDKSLVKVTEDNIVEDWNCDSYDKALDAFQQAFHTTDDMKACLALVLASIWSIKFDDMEQLWLKIIGPPGSGKTRIAKAISASDQVVSKSTFTGLFSGWRETVQDQEDHGLIPIISGKTLVVKDADALLRQADVERIFSEMRDFYDKDSSPHFRNKVSRDYRNIKSTFIICGTQQLRSADHSFLGERFMSCELSLNDEEKKVIRRKVVERNIAVATGTLKAPERCIMSAMKGWINHLMQRELDSQIPDDMIKIIEVLSELTAIMRTEVHRDRRRRITTPAVPETSFRIIGQTITAAYALCVVHGLNRADGTIYDIITKMLKDTINPRGTRYRICEAFMHHKDISPSEIAVNTGLSLHEIDEEIFDMLELGILHREKVVASSATKFRYRLSLNSEVRAGLQEIVYE